MQRIETHNHWFESQQPIACGSLFSRTHQENTSYHPVNVMQKKIVEQLYIISFWNLERQFAELLAQALFQHCDFVIGAHISSSNWLQSKLTV